MKGNYLFTLITLLALAYSQFNHARGQLDYSYESGDGELVGHYFGASYDIFENLTFYGNLSTGTSGEQDYSETNFGATLYAFSNFSFDVRFHRGSEMTPTPFITPNTNESSFTQENFDMQTSAFNYSITYLLSNLWDGEKMTSLTFSRQTKEFTQNGQITTVFSVNTATVDIYLSFIQTETTLSLSQDLTENLFATIDYNSYTYQNDSYYNVTHTVFTNRNGERDLDPLFLYPDKKLNLSLNYYLTEKWLLTTSYYQTVAIQEDFDSVSYGFNTSYDINETFTLNYSYFITSSSEDFKFQSLGLSYRF